jgi:putative ABC transport system substrate-binding protein
MNRRDVIVLIGGAATWPVAAGAQQPAMPVVGYLSSRTRESEVSLLAAFRQGLAAAGYVENQNVTIEYRFADGQNIRLPALTADLLGRKLNVIATAGGTPVALAVKAATTTIPIVFQVGNDPVQYGLVASLSHPGGNMTGIYSQAGDLVAKNLGLLRELVPKAKTVAVLANTTNPNAESFTRDVQAAASALGLQLHVLRATTETEIEAAFANLIQQPADAMLITIDPFFFSRAARIAELAASHGVPAIYGRRPFAEAGGLVSYGDDVTASYHQAGAWTGRILKGEKPADLPVIQTNKFELVINLKSAKALGLTIPPGLLATADEVIE